MHFGRRAMQCKCQIQISLCGPAERSQIMGFGDFRGSGYIELAKRVNKWLSAYPPSPRDTNPKDFSLN